MITPELGKLLSVTGEPLGLEAAEPPEVDGSHGSDLAALLRHTNGFYAFESALHVFPCGDTDHGMTLEVWNSEEGWRSAYGPEIEGHWFFAADVFGGQFSITDAGVFTFDPETGEVQLLASSLEGWAEQILEDYEVLTGFPVAHEWQVGNGPLPAGQRLVPKQPFVLGGAFSVENVFPLDALDAMRLRSQVARDIAGLPDGSPVEIDIDD